MKRWKLVIVIFAIFVVTDFFYCVIYIRANGPRANGPDTTSANPLEYFKVQMACYFSLRTS